MAGRMDPFEGFVADAPPLRCQLASSNWLDLISGWRLTPPCLSLLSRSNLLISLTAAEHDSSLPASSAPQTAEVCGHTAVLPGLSYFIFFLSFAGKDWQSKPLFFTSREAGSGKNVADRMIWKTFFFPEAYCVSLTPTKSVKSLLFCLF